MTKVYAINTADDEGTVYATENGKILKVHISFCEGMISNYVFDSCVKDIELDSQTSVESLYWLTKEEYDGLKCWVKEYDWNLDFDEPIPNVNVIGDRTVIKPLDLHTLM